MASLRTSTAVGSDGHGGSSTTQPLTQAGADLHEVLVSHPSDYALSTATATPLPGIAITAASTNNAGGASDGRPAGRSPGNSTAPAPDDQPPAVLESSLYSDLELDMDPGPTDERAALLSAWQRSDCPTLEGQPAGIGSGAGAGVAVRPPMPPGTAHRRAAASSGAKTPAAAVAGTAAGPRRAGVAAFEVAGSSAGGAGSGRGARAAGTGGAAASGRQHSGMAAGGWAGHMGSPTSGAAQRGPGRVQADRQGSTLLTAATAAGDLHTAVPAPLPLSPGPGPGAPPATTPGPGPGPGSGPGPELHARPGAHQGPQALGRKPSAVSAGSSALGGAFSDPDDTTQKLNEYVRDEQLRHASETRSYRLSAAGAKRLFMLAVTGGFLAAAIYLSTIPWGRQERAGLPTWRWFLLVGCLPSVWYIPWFTIFLVVLLLESLLPVAVPGSPGRGAGGLMAAGSGAAAGGGAGAAAGVGGHGAGAGVASDRGSNPGGPAMVIYHILGVRRHMVRVLRSLCGQLLVHYTIVDYLDPADRQREGDFMKTWTCLTLFLTANTLKSLIAKALSKHFHSRGYLDRMQQAVKQELVLMALSRPRPGRAHSNALTHLGLSYHLAHIFGYGPGQHSASGPTATRASPASGRSAGRHRGASVGMADGTARARGPGGAGGAGDAGGVGGSGLIGMRSPFAALAGADAAAAAAAAASGLGAGGAMGAVPAAAVGLTPQDSWAGAAAAAVTAAGSRQGPGRLSGDRRLCRSSGDLLGLASSQREQQQQAARQAPTAGKTADGYLHGGKAAYGMGSGGSGNVASVTGGKSRGGLRSFWGWLSEHLSMTYRRTKVQWDLSRPSNAANPPSNHRRLRVPTPGVPRVGKAGGGSGGTGGGGLTAVCGSGSVAAAGGRAAVDPVGPDGLNYDQLRVSLFWLEQHIRRNKLRMGVTLTDQLHAAAEGGEEANEVTSKTEAKRLAFYLHMNVLGLSDLRGRKYLVARDFEPFFNSAEEVREAFSVFDSDRDGRITLQNMVDTIVRIYKERKKLALTLQDTRTVVAKLELICGVVLHVLFGFSYLVIFQVNVRELWLTFSSVTLAFVFVFGNSIRNIYEAVLFLFVVHPFDVGDWLVLTNGEMVKVEEIAMLFCTFLKGDGHRLYYPNSKLIGEPVINVSRSETYWDSVTLLVDLATPGSVLEAVETRLKRWLGDNPTQFTGSGGVLARSLANPAKLQLTASWEYCHNGEDAGRTARWRSKTVLVLASALDSAGTSYTLPALKEGRMRREAAAAVGLIASDVAIADGGGSSAVAAGGAAGVQLSGSAAMVMQGM